MDVHGKEPGEVDSKSSWLDTTLRQFNFIAVMRERNQIRRTCVESLKIYRQVAEEIPEASKTALYTRFIEKRCVADPRDVREIIRHAVESFASWPVERDLTFRDLVCYLAITECLQANPTEIGVHARVFDVVSNIIPADL